MRKLVLLLFLILIPSYCYSQVDDVAQPKYIYGILSYHKSTDTPHQSTGVLLKHNNKLFLSVCYHTIFKHNIKADSCTLLHNKIDSLGKLICDTNTTSCIILSVKNHEYFHYLDSIDLVLIELNQGRNVSWNGVSPPPSYDLFEPGVFDILDEVHYKEAFNSTKGESCYVIGYGNIEKSAQIIKIRKNGVITRNPLDTCLPSFGGYLFCDEFIETYITASNGMSGSPLYIKKQRNNHIPMGFLVGTNKEVGPDEKATYYFTPSYRIREIIENIKTKSQ